MQREKVVAHYAAFREKIKDFAFFFFFRRYSSCRSQLTCVQVGEGRKPEGMGLPLARLERLQSNQTPKAKPNTDCPPGGPQGVRSLCPRV